MKKYFLYIILIYGGNIFSQQLPEKLFDEFFGLISHEKAKNTPVILIFEKNKEADTLFSTEQTKNKDIQTYHLHLINEGRIFSQLIPFLIKQQDSSIEYHYKVEQYKIQKIDTLIFFSSAEKKFPNNLKKKIQNKVLYEPLNYKTLTYLNSEFKDITPYIEFKKTAPVIYKNFTGAKVEYTILEKQQLSAEINTLIQNNKTLWQGYLHLDLYNIFSQSEKLIFNWRKENEIQKLNLNLDFPYLMSTNMYLKGDFYISSGKETATQSKYGLESGLIDRRWKAGLNYYRLAQSKNIKNLIGIKISYRSVNNPLYRFDIKKEGKFSFSKEINSQNEYLVKGEVSYPVSLSEKYTFLIHNKIYKSFSSQGLFFLEDPENPVNQSIKAMYVKDEYFINLKLIKNYKTSLLYLTGSFSLFKSEKENSQFNSGIGIKNLGKSGIMTIEINYSIIEYYNCKKKGILLKIKHNIKF